MMKSFAREIDLNAFTALSQTNKSTDKRASFAYITLQSIKTQRVFHEAQIDQNHHTYQRPAHRKK